MMMTINGIFSRIQPHSHKASNTSVIYKQGVSMQNVVSQAFERLQDLKKIDYVKNFTVNC